MLLMALARMRTPLRSAVEDMEFLSDDVCLVPGEVMTRVDVAPGNARRIYCGIDIAAEVHEVYELLTDYEALGDVVPNLVANEILEKKHGGARLRQVGAAQVLPGLNFRASMVLDVRELPDGLPVREMSPRLATGPLQRGVYPQPWAQSGADSMDVAMQSVAGDTGDFTLYQGLWRAQALRSCAMDGRNATRLTFSVEIQPRPWLPVALVESRIAQDLVTNMKAVAAEATRRATIVVQDDDLVGPARLALLKAVDRVDRAGWGAPKPVLDDVMNAAEQLSRANALRGVTYAFNSAAAGSWEVLFSSNLAKTALHDTSTDLAIAKAALRFFPRRATTALGRLALKSVDVDIFARQASTFLHTVVAFRAPFAAPAVRLEHVLIAPKRPYAATMARDKIRLEPADPGLKNYAPKPALPTAWLAKYSFKNIVSFDVVHLDDNLLVTLDDANDLKVCRRHNRQLDLSNLSDDDAQPAPILASYSSTSPPPRRPSDAFILQEDDAAANTRRRSPSS